MGITNTRNYTFDAVLSLNLREKHIIFEWSVTIDANIFTFMEVIGFGGRF